MDLHLFKEYQSQRLKTVKMAEASKGIDYDSIAYGKKENEQVLFFVPNNANKNSKVAVFIAGGVWGHMNAKYYAFVGKMLASCGYVALIVGAEKTKKAKYPIVKQKIMSGILHGIEFLRKHNFNAKELVLIGSSTGALVASLIAFDKQDYAISGIDAKVVGFCSIAGILNFECQTKLSKHIFKKFFPKGYDTEYANPITFAGKEDKDIKILCLHGDNDPVFDKQNVLNFKYALYDKIDNNVEVFLSSTVGYMGHMDFIFNVFENDACKGKKVLSKWLKTLNE